MARRASLQQYQVSLAFASRRCRRRASFRRAERGAAIACELPQCRALYGPFHIMDCLAPPSHDATPIEAFLDDAFRPSRDDRKLRYFTSCQDEASSARVLRCRHCHRPVSRFLYGRKRAPGRADFSMPLAATVRRTLRPKPPTAVLAPFSCARDEGWDQRRRYFHYYVISRDFICFFYDRNL